MLWALPVSADDLDRKAAADSLNAFRADRGRSALRYSTELEKTAQIHADDMVRNDFFSHTGSDGSGVGVRLTRNGYGSVFYTHLTLPTKRRE